MNNLNLALLKKQMEDNKKNAMFSSFSRYPTKKDEEDEDEGNNAGGGFFQGNQYIC